MLSNANAQHQLRMMIYVRNLDMAAKYKIDPIDLPQVVRDKAWMDAVVATDNVATNMNKGIQRRSK